MRKRPKRVAPADDRLSKRNRASQSQLKSINVSGEHVKVEPMSNAKNVFWNFFYSASQDGSYRTTESLTAKAVLQHRTVKVDSVVSLLKHYLNLVKGLL